MPSYIASALFYLGGLIYGAAACYCIFVAPFTAVPALFVAMSGSFVLFAFVLFVRASRVRS